MKQRFFAFILLFCCLCGIGADEIKPLFGFTPFLTDGISAEESRLIENLLQSYLAEMGELVLWQKQPGGVVPAQPDTGRPPDYTISGHIRQEDGGHFFLLEIENTGTGEIYSVSSVYQSTGELALKARSLLEAAFSGSMEMEPEASSAATPERLSENLITGTWKGDAGIEMIHLRRGGRGVAVFSSGAQMVLSYAIEDDTLKIWQISPNSERFYYPQPRPAVGWLVQDAEPMLWELSLYKGGTVLGGVQMASAVRMANGAVVELVPGGDVRQVQWTKLVR